MDFLSILHLGELKLNGMAIIILFSWYIAITILFERDSNIRTIMTNLSCACTSYTFAFASTWWVIKQYRKTLQSKTDHHDTDTATITFMTLEEVFNTVDGFEVFANHLVNEFSTENLFFVLEMMQIKRQILQNKLCMYLLYVYEKYCAFVNDTK